MGEFQQHLQVFQTKEAPLTVPLEFGVFTGVEPIPKQVRSDSEKSASVCGPITRLVWNTKRIQRYRRRAEVRFGQDELKFAKITKI